MEQGTYLCFTQEELCNEKQNKYSSSILNVLHFIQRVDGILNYLRCCISE